MRIERAILAAGRFRKKIGMFAGSKNAWKVLPPADALRTVIGHQEERSLDLATDCLTCLSVFFLMQHKK
jgi:hypothetical protein